MILIPTNIKEKTVLSNAFVNSKKKSPAAAAPVFDEYKVICDKFNKGLYERWWPHIG